MKRLAFVLAILTLIAIPVLAGEWHTGQSNLCADCHTMHNSMAHKWDGTPGAVSVGTPVADGNWVRAGVAGGGDYLLKAADPNALCLSCHNNQTFAPDVLGSVKGVNDATNRSAGYLNDTSTGNLHTGHTLGATNVAPGGTFTPDPILGLECINCHTQHGRAGIYRNLGPRTAVVPTYALNGQQPADITGEATDLTTAITNDDIDVFINLPGPYVANTSIFSELYETANISYLKRTTPTDGSENRSGNQCAACHGSFHGAPNSTNIGGELNGTFYEKFNRHPVGGVVLGAVGGGHSDLASVRYAAAGSYSRVKVYADNQTTFADATPGCVSCHKAHGNGQPFGLIFANRTANDGAATPAGVMTEEGTMAANPTPTGAETAIGQRALCGQCHRQGN